MCEHTGELQVHHVAKLAQLTTPGRPQPAWAQVMAKRRRKTLVVCPPATTPSITGNPPRTTE